MSKSVMNESGFLNAITTKCIKISDDVIHMVFETRQDFLDFLRAYPTSVSFDFPRHIPKFFPPGDWCYVTVRIRGLNEEEEELFGIYQYLPFVGREFFRKDITRFVPEGVVSGPDDRKKFLLAIAKQIHNREPVSEGDWKMFLKVLVGSMQHWEKRQDAKVKLCSCGYFVHECFRGDVPEEIFEARGFTSSGDFVQIANDLLADFRLSTGRQVSKEDSTMTIYHIVSALVSPRETIPIPHRIVALKVLCAHLDVNNDYVRRMIDAARRMLSDDVFALPKALVPEFLDELVGGFVESVTVVVDFFQAIGLEIGEMLMSVVGKMRDAVLAGKAWIGEAIADMVEEALRVRIGEMANNMKNKVLAVIRHPMFTVMWKTMVRWWMGYKITHIALELVLDGGFTSVVAGFFSSFMQRERENVAPEAFDKSVILVIFVTLFLGMLFTLNPKVGAVDGKFLHSLCRNLSDAANAMDKLKVREGINGILEYLYGVQIGEEERARFKTMYPNTMSFIEAHVRYVSLNQPLKGDEHWFRSMYVAYLKERSSSWSAKDFSRLNAISMAAHRAAQAIGASEDFKARRQPDFFLFYGPPGCGKSQLTTTISKAIARMDLNISGMGHRNEQELIYALDKNDQYFSGYCNQTLWIIEEFLQRVDVVGMPARDMSVLFNLCTTTPLQLNMAAVEEKGMVGRAYLIVGSSNVMFDRQDSPSLVIAPYVNSFVEPAAVARRVSHYVKPVLKDPYVYDERASRIAVRLEEDGVEHLEKDIYVNPDDLYEFDIIDSAGTRIISPNGNRRWSYKELIVEMWQSYQRVKNYDPEASGEESATYDLLNEYLASNGGVMSKEAEKEEQRGLEAEVGWGVPASMLAAAFTSWYTDSKAASVAVGAAGYALLNDQRLCSCDSADFPYPNSPEECMDVFVRQLSDAGDRCIPRVVMPKGERLYCADVDRLVQITDNNAYYTDKRIRKYASVWRECYLVSAEDHPRSDVIHSWKGFESSMFVLANLANTTGVATFRVPNSRDVRMEEDVMLVGEEKEEKFSFAGVEAKYLNITIVTVPYRLRHLSTSPHMAKILNWVALPLVGAIVGAGVCNAVRWLKSTVIVTDKGEARYDSEAGLIVDLKEGERVMLAGRWYVQKKTKDGFKLYPQSVDVPQELMEAVDVPTRLVNALPSIKNSLFAVVDKEDNLVGNLFAINSSQFLCPLHVARLLERQHGLMLKRDSFIRPICGNTVDMRNVVVHCIGEGDLAVVEFMSTQTPVALEGCRKHITKFLDDEAPSTGFARLCYRNHRGELVYGEGVFTRPDYKCAQYVISEGGKEVVYETPSNRVREWDGPSKNGFCGAIYLDMSQSAETPILGIHIARDKEKDRAIMHNVFQKDFKCLERLAVPIGNTPVVLTPESQTAEFLSMCGLYDVGEGEKRRMNSESAKRRSWLYELIDPKYDLAPLKPFVNTSGQLIDPWAVALKKLGVKSLEHIRIADGVMDVARCIGEHYSQFYERKPLPSWESAFSSECGLPSIRRKKAAGSQFKRLGVSKGITCVRDEDVPTPTPEWIELLTRLERRLAPDDWHKGVDGLVQYAAKCDGCLKDEPRLKEKCEIGKTRLFTSVPVHEFLLERRYFSNLVSQITEKNIVFNSALGLSPSDFGSIHEYLREAGEDCVVYAFDFEHMDGSVKLWMIRLIAYITHLIMSERSGYIVDPEFPPFDREDFVRYRLLMRLGCFVLSVFDALVNVGTMHPSGSFLTCYINHMVQMVSLVWTFRQILGPTVDILNEFKFILLGDDSLISVPKQYAELIDLGRVRLFAQQLGYKLTGSTHEEVLESYALWRPSPIRSDYVFLGRRFCLVKGEVYGMLEPSRVEKTLAFVGNKRAVETFPQQMMAVLEELVKFRASEDEYYLESYRKMKKILDDEVGDGFCDWALDKVENGEHSDVLLRCTRYTLRKLSEEKRFKPEAGETTEQLGGNSQADTTTFVSNVVEDVESVVMMKDLDLAEHGMELAEHSESDAFVRPFKITSFVWDATTPPNPVNLYLPSAFFNGYPNAQFKLANFAFLRGRMCIRVVISSTPYSAGKLLLSCRPLGPLALTPYQASGDICSEIDAASGATAEISIATTLPQRWANVEKYNPALSGPNIDFDWCTVQLFVASALAQVGVGSVNVSVYGWIEEGELRGPTLTNFTLAPQAKGISEQLHNTAGFVKEEVVPMVKTIGGLMMECASVIKTAATIAAFAGLSKPAMQNNTVVQTQNVNFDGPHMFGVAPAIKMCCSQQQRGVMPEKIFNFTEDQMDIPTFCSRPGLARIYSWGVTDAPEAVIGLWRVNPGVCSGGVGVYNHTPLSYVAGAFRLWRGTLYFRIALAKTRFHSGTLEVVWQMGIANSSITTDYQATNCYRAVWDVQESSDFEIEVPYVGNLPWCATMIENDSNGGPLNYCPTGFLSLRVVNPLGTSLGQVTDSVDVLVYAYGGKDIEFAVPSLYTLDISPPVEVMRSYDGKRVVKPKSKGKEAVRFVPEVGGGVFQEDKTVEKETVGRPLKMAQAVPPDVGSAISCVGESVGNLRLLLKRMSFPVLLSAPAPGSDLVILPWYQMHNHQKFVNYFSRCFSFFSGGVVVQVNYYSQVSPTTDYYYIYLKWCNTTLPGMPCIPYSLQDGSNRLVEIPYQNIAPFAPMNMLQTSDATKTLPYTLAISCGNLSTTTKFLFSFSGSDDLTFGWQIGPEALGASNASSLNTPQYNNYY